MNSTQNITSGTPRRESNLELLRIICMYGVIVHHCIVHGGSYNISYCNNQYIALLLMPAGKIAFDCFLALSTYFLVDAEFSGKRLLRIYFEVLFYSVLFYFIALQMGLSDNSPLGPFFVIIGNSHGFAAAYIVLYLLLPFLTRLTRSINKKQVTILILLLFYVEVVSKFFGQIISYSQPFPSEIILFVLFYFISLYLKRWPFRWMKYPEILISLIILIWFCLWQVWCGAFIYTEQEIGSGIKSWIPILVSNFTDESSVTNIVAGYALFYLFRCIKIKNNVLINRIAASTFGVLLIHDHNYFRPFLWHNLLHVEDWYYSDLFALRVFATAGIVFVVTTIIDVLRIDLIEKHLCNSNIINKVSNKIDSIWSESI